MLQPIPEASPIRELAEIPGKIHHDLTTYDDSAFPDFQLAK